MSLVNFGHDRRPYLAVCGVQFCLSSFAVKWRLSPETLIQGSLKWLKSEQCALAQCLWDLAEGFHLIMISREIVETLLVGGRATL